MLGSLPMLVRSSASRAVRSSTTTATTGVRVLLASSVARVLLNVLAAEYSCTLVTTWPQDMRARCIQHVKPWYYGGAE